MSMDETQTAIGVAMQATDDMNGAVARFRAALPGWWYTMGRCGLTCHASIGPDRFYIEQPFLNRYDKGFDADIPNPTTCEAALDEAVAKALAALAQDAEWQSRREQCAQ